MLQRKGRLVVLEMVYQTMPYLLPNSHFFSSFIKDWLVLAYNWYSPFCYFSFLEPHCHHKASNHPIISKLMHHFYLQNPHSHKYFDPLDVKCLLLFLESCAPAYFLTNFKLALKTATHLALVTAKHCCDLTLLCIDNQNLFHQHHAVIFIPVPGAKQIGQVIFLLRFLFLLIPMLIFTM